MQSDSTTRPAKAAKGSSSTGEERIGRNVAFAWAGYMVNMVSGFVVPRLISDRLGQNTLGIWDFSWSIISYFALVSLGLGASINRYVAHYRAKNDIEGLNRSCSTIVFFLRCVGGLALVAAIVVSLWVLPLMSDRLGNGLNEAQWVVVFLGLEISSTLIMNVYGSVMVACHRADIHNTISAICYGATAAVMVVVLMFGGNLPELALAHCIVSIAADVARWRVVKRVCPEMKFNRHLASWEVFKEQLRYSTKSMIPIISGLLSFQALSLLITFFLGPASLAIFSRSRGLMNTLRTMSAKFGNILLPASTAMHARNDREGLVTTFLATSRGITAIMLLPIVTIAILGDDIVRIWMGPQYVVPGIVALLSLGTMMSVIQEPAWSVLSAMNQHGKIAIVKLVAATISTGLIALMMGVFHWGLVGAAVLFVLPQVFVDGGWTCVRACARLHLSTATFFRHSLLAPLLYLAPYAVGLQIAEFLFANSVVGAFAITLVGGAITAVLYYRHILTPNMRESLGRKLQRLFRRFGVKIGAPAASSV